MADTIGWLIKKILVPLFPTLLAALIRYFQFRQISLEIVDGGVLSLSMALSCFQIMNSINRSLIGNKSRESLNIIYFLLIFSFLLMFAISSSYKLDMETAMSQNIMQIKSLSQSGLDVNSSILQTLNDPRIDKLPTILIIRESAIYLSLVAIFIATNIKIKYDDLED